MFDEEAKRVSVLLAAGGFGGLIVGVVRGVVQDKHSGWVGFIRGALASMFVGVIVSSGLDGVVMSTTLKVCIVSMSCYVADDILLSITTLARLASSDPFGFFARFRRAWAGVKEEEPKA